MKRMFKAAFQQPYTPREIAATIETHLIKPPFPGKWYDVAQSVKDKNGRGLADAWRETMIIDEIKDIASRPTWKTQKQKLLEYILDHKHITKFYIHMKDVKNEEARDILFEGCYDDKFMEWENTSLLSQQFLTSMVSEAVLYEIGKRLYHFDNFLDLQLEYWNGLTNRFQELKCGLWDRVYSSDDIEAMHEFMREVLHPLLSEYSGLVKTTSRQIASECLDIEAIKQKNLEIETQIIEIGQILLDAADENTAVQKK
jgi:hypothetical protein